MESTEQSKKTFKSKGGRPQKKIKRDTGIRVRLSQTEHYLIEQKARQSGMKISDWFRYSAKRAKIVSRFSSEEMKLLRALSGMANNLNQLTKLAHQQGLLFVERKCRELLPQIDSILKQLTSDDR